MISSANPSRIPVRNIYYMLVYAWDYPHEKNSISVYQEDEKNLLTLFSKVLLAKVTALLKKGFYKDYIERNDESSILRGKILFKESVQTFSFKRGKMHIEEEEMTYDILHNQIIKATLYYLSSHSSVDKKYRDEIRSILTFFERITLIKMDLKYFQKIRLHRNNKHYQFILNICQFIWEDAFIHEGEGQKKFQDFSREHHQMARLFENFVKNFYRKEIPGSKAISESFYWPAEGENTDLLPIMKTDISLTVDDKKFIMDTKFYKDMFGFQWNQEKIRSAHLYQLFSYLKNDEFYHKKKAAGILLYPRVQQSVDVTYKMHGFDIRVCTLDLGKEWREIHERLLGIVEE